MSTDHTDARRCTATAKGSGQRCKRLAIPGGTVCVKHGGGAVQVRAAAERRLAERQALRDLESFGVPVVVDPHTALLQELHRTAGAVAWLGALVAELDRDDIAWGVTEELSKQSGEFPGTDTTKAAKPNVWYELWARERKHLVDVAAACVRAGIEERRIQLAEAQGALLAGVIQRILGRLELTETQQQLVAQVVPEELRAISTGDDS